MAAASAVVDQHDFKRLSLRNIPKLDKGESSEAGFWRKYQFPITIKHSAPISSIHFSPAVPHDYVVTSGPRVQIYSHTNNQVKKTISRFRQSAYSACFRRDGQLIAAGSEEGVVKVFDGGSRSILRQFKGHTKACKAVQFSSGGHKLFSGSDDTTVKCWDLPTQQCLLTLHGHEDYIRRVYPSPNNPDLLMSASYDHTLCLWDMRCAESAVLELNHDAPIEDIVIFPSGSLCVSCGSHWLRVWDLLAGGRMLLTLANHLKTVTSVCCDGGSERLFSAGLDKQVKVYSLRDYSVVHSMSYPAPILSMAMSPTDSHFVVGMSSKFLNVKCRPPKHDLTEDRSVFPSHSGSRRYFTRGRANKPSQDEYIVTVSKPTRFKDYENYLRKFKYKQALLSALESQDRGKSLVIYSLLQELARRDGLTIALSGLTQDELAPLLTFLSKNLTTPHFTPLLLDVCNIVTDIYSCVLSKSKMTKALFRVIKVKVDKEVEFQKHAFQLLGCMDMLLTAASVSKHNHIR